jgi:glycyl-tRNA synthetase beta chain
VSLPLLVEIGTEEIPDWMIESALANWKELFEAFLEAHQLGAPTSLRMDATPRRLTLRAEGVAERQPDKDELVLGPPKAAAYKDGQPTGAALGFAKKNGVGVEDLQIHATAKGEYLGFRRTVVGRTTKDLLTAALPEMILRIYFPKTMYWTGKGGARFIRPVRWLVALLGNEVVPFELAGVQSGRSTAGHRRLGESSVEVTVENYEAELRRNFVILDAAERRGKIEAETTALLEPQGLRAKPDPGLLETLVYITEYPTPILGAFDPAYLELPEEVLITVMKHHQKYLSVENSDGKLAPHFVAVMNTSEDPNGLVRQGNERVMRARFNDARFFLGVDAKKTLESRLPELENVTFQKELGSYREKTAQIEQLCGTLAAHVDVEQTLLERAARLSKCDLTTEMVKEFTELQGVMGGLYARAQGEPEPVWRAIYEHYKPVSMEDSVPSTRTGQLVSLADKVDTLRRCFAIGMIPSGSRDPFALRRAAQGVVKILVEGKLALPLRLLTGESATLEEFLLDRVRYYFREVRGFRYDEVNAVLAAGYDDLVDVESRLLAIQRVRPTQNFEPLAASFKRIQNILKQAQFAGGAEIDPSLLEAGPEAALFEGFRKVRTEVEAFRASRQYEEALKAIASLRPVVDHFFDKVLVNAPDERIRQNRLGLLHHLLTEFSAISDFSEIVTVQP